MMYILDTNVISELRKIRSGKADRNVAKWADSVAATDLYISSITVLELELGVVLSERRDPTTGALLRAWLDNHVLPAFTGRVIPIDTAVAKYSAGLHVPDPRPIRDALIAATAIIHGMTMVTRNVIDFEPTGVIILNPWSEPDQ